MIPSPLAEQSFHILVTPTLLFGVMALLLLGWSVFTLIVQYHWKNYGTGKLEVFTMNFFYLVGSLLFIAFLAALAILYHLSK